MPVVVLLDNSLSMARPVSTEDPRRRLDVACAAAHELLLHLEVSPHNNNTGMNE